jgi:hypothetical protein
MPPPRIFAVALVRHFYGLGAPYFAIPETIAETPLHLDVVTRTAKLVFDAGLYRLGGLPWIVPIVLLAWRRRAFPLLVCALTLGVTIFFYIHSPNPSWWISASAMRVLMTPLTALIVAVLESRADGVVPEGEEAEGGGREIGRDARGALGQV